MYEGIIFMHAISVSFLCGFCNVVHVYIRSIGIACIFKAIQSLCEIEQRKILKPYVHFINHNY